MAALYTAEAIAIGEGRNGEVRSSDGVIDEVLSVPKELGGPGGDKTNPEQLFAAGYAACFHSAMQAVARRQKITLPETSITAKVSLLPLDGGAFTLAVAMTAHVPGFEQGAADQLVAAAHQVCPYSYATRGNIEVVVNATV